MLTDKERIVLDIIIQNKEITSEALKDLFGVPHGLGHGKVLTKKNFPNIRQYLKSHMTAYRHGMYRGGFCWVSVVDCGGISQKDVMELKDEMNR